MLERMSRLSRFSPLPGQEPSNSSPQRTRRNRPIFINHIPDSFNSSGASRSTIKPVPKISDRLYSRSTKPNLRWREEDSKGVTGSGWSPFKGANLYFLDETDSKAKISLIIEPAAPGVFYSIAGVLCVPCWPYFCKGVSSKAEAHGYFFELNPETGQLTMMLKQNK